MELLLVVRARRCSENQSTGELSTDFERNCHRAADLQCFDHCKIGRIVDHAIGARGFDADAWYEERLSLSDGVRSKVHPLRPRRKTSNELLEHAQASLRN